ncbi:PREDICTED: uncharacterized protein LOC104608122 [Nelumbo nucifera]|uniref:Uncharacterized protein LOC104608122 n=1 Tax=Nelumbo nucifera TaxID=4432 RepID=A0A1U8AVY8_NELNU|nr:PREDICTED: uncharacterized protein LOC104608122 [Nelumbo nucifera]
MDPTMDVNEHSLEDVPMLTGDNYKSWKKNMEEYLSEKGLWHHISEPQPEEAEYGWVEQDLKVLMKIEETCDRKIHPYIKSLSPAKVIWDQLAVMYGKMDDFGPRWKGKVSTCYTWCLPFFNAIATGEWSKVEEFVNKNRGTLTARITVNGETPLHIAAKFGKESIVKELLLRMDEESVKKRALNEATALHFAVIQEQLQIAKVLVNKVEALVLMKFENMTAVALAAKCRHKDLVAYLCPITLKEEDKFKGLAKPKDYECVSAEIDQNRATLLTSLINVNFFDEALDIFNRFPNLVLTEDIHGKTAVHSLARNTSAFRRSSWFFQRRIYSCLNLKFFCNGRGRNQDEENLNQACEEMEAPTTCLKKINPEDLQYPNALRLLDKICVEISVIDINDAQSKALMTSTIFSAIRIGNVVFVTEMLRYCPQFAYLFDDNDLGIIHQAIIHRRKKIFNLIDSMDLPRQKMVRYRSSEKENILHITAKRAPIDRLNQKHSPAKELQNELRWFKLIGNTVPPTLQDSVNNKGQTPAMLFMEEHKELWNDAKQWLKDTANSGMVVAALVASVMLSTALSLPSLSGTGKADTGEIHIKFTNHNHFYNVVIATMISLFFASASLLSFLSVYISHQTGDDFLHHLPRMLSMGLLFLYISVSAMIATFITTIFMVFRNGIVKVMLPPALLAIIPVLAFAALSQFPVFKDMLFSSYGLNRFTKRRKGYF